MRLENVSKRYGSGAAAVDAVRDVSLELFSRTFTAIMGPSGSGKTSLMQCAAGLDRPTSGRVFLAGVEISRLRDPKLTKFRRRHVGFVFQAFNLVGSLTVRDNATLPLRFAGEPVDPAWVDEILARVGLDRRVHHRPAQLSGGQQQRVAIARALVARPAVIFADEPTGALDRETALEILALLRQAVDELGQTVVMVSHDAAAAAEADSVCFLADGRLAAELQQPTINDVAAQLANLRR